MYYIPIIELPVLILLVLIRSLILRRQGINAFVFGVTDKSDFFLVPVILICFYSLLAALFNWPFPDFLKNLFWKNSVQILLAVALCTVSLIWFVLTLKSFGKSFRVGIDTQTKDKLITNGTFAASRNPIYTAFIFFFIGIFLAYPTIMTLFFLVLLIAAIHRQILREEKFLREHYGSEYEEYCKKVRRYL